MATEIPELPDYLLELFEKSAEKLTDHKHKVTLAEALLQNKDALAKNKQDMFRNVL